MVKNTTSFRPDEMINLMMGEVPVPETSFFYDIYDSGQVIIILI